MTVHDAIRSHLLAPLGPLDPLPRTESLEVTRRLNEQRFAEFERLSRNRQGVGRHRYEIPTGRAPHAQIEAAIDRLRRYLESGNQEHLVDAANLCALEFVNPGSHPSPSFRSTDDGKHVEE